MSDSIKLTNRQILKIRDGLKSLDGIEGKGGEIIRFDFDTGLSWNITKNTVLIERAAETYDRERQKLMRKHGVTPGEQVTAANAEKVARWGEELDALKDATQDVSGLLKMKKVEFLKAGVGKVPSILANLFDLVEE